MKVIEVIRKGDSRSQARIEALGQEGYTITQMPAAWLSAITAMNIAKAVEREGASGVLVHTVTDAMAAISARKIVGNGLRIAVSIPPNSKVSSNITAEIIAGVDKWIFPSQRLLEKFPSTLKNTMVRAPWDYEMQLPNKAECKPETGRLLWIEPIGSDIKRLMHAIDQVEQDNGATTLIIVGTGKAQHVMRAVRHARAIGCPQCVVWKGEDFNLTEELKRASAIVQSADDATGSELRATAQLGIPLI